MEVDNSLHTKAIAAEIAALIQPQQVMNFKGLFTTVAGAAILGLFAWVFTMSERVTLLENNMARISSDISKVLTAVESIKSNRFTSADWEMRASPMVARVKKVEDEEAGQWKVIRDTEAIAKQNTNDIRFIKEYYMKKANN